MEENKKKRKKATPPKVETEQEKADAADGDVDPEFLRLKALVLAHLDKLLLEPCDKGVFTNYDEWDDTLYLKILDFKEERGVYPNIMLARKSTYRKIEEAVSRNPDGVEWNLSDDIEANFYGDDFSIIFCLDTENKLKADEFKLIFDEDPTFDGEEEPSSYVRLKSA